MKVVYDRADLARDVAAACGVKRARALNGFLGNAVLRSPGRPGLSCPRLLQVVSCGAEGPVPILIPTLCKRPSDEGRRPEPRELPMFPPVMRGSS